VYTSAHNTRVRARVIVSPPSSAAAVALVADNRFFIVARPATAAIHKHTRARVNTHQLPAGTPIPVDTPHLKTLYRIIRRRRRRDCVRARLYHIVSVYNIIMRFLGATLSENDPRVRDIACARWGRRAARRRIRYTLLRAFGKRAPSPVSHSSARATD